MIQPMFKKQAKHSATDAPGFVGIFMSSGDTTLMLHLKSVKGERMLYYNVPGS